MRQTSSMVAPAASSALLMFSHACRACSSMSPTPATVPSARRAVMPETNTSLPLASTVIAWERCPTGSARRELLTWCFAIEALGYTGHGGENHAETARLAACGSLRRFRAALSEQAGAPHRAVPAGRHRRPDRTHRAAEVRAVPRPAADRRLPRRRWRLDRHTRGDEGCARRLHAAAVLRHARRQPPHLQARARPGKDARPRHADGELA